MTDRRRGHLKVVGLFLAANVVVNLAGLPFDQPVRTVVALFGGLVAGMVAMTVALDRGWIKL